MAMAKDRVLFWAVSLSFFVHVLALAQLHLRGAAMPTSDPLTMTVQLMPLAVPKPTAALPSLITSTTRVVEQPLVSKNTEVVPVLTTKPVETPIAAAAAVPVMTSAMAQSQASQPVAIAPPRFDADYLDNPRPAYPAMSRRLGEEGKVLLRVLVGSEGRAHEVQLKEGSGFARLDQAAREAVLRWRFVPARKGGEAVEGWVLVPITFNLS